MLLQLLQPVMRWPVRGVTMFGADSRMRCMSADIGGQQYEQYMNPLLEACLVSRLGTRPLENIQDIQSVYSTCSQASSSPNRQGSRAMSINMQATLARLNLAALQLNTKASPNRERLDGSMSRLSRDNKAERCPLSL